MRKKASPAIPLPGPSEVNDLGEPRQFEEDGLTVTRSATWSPPGCHPVGCGLRLYADKDGKLVKVEGDESHPVTQGRLCARCLTMADHAYNPSRITKCTKRDPKCRGRADKWEVVGYDEALGIIEAEYNRLTAQYGRETVILIGGTGREGGACSPYASAVFRAPTLCCAQPGCSRYIPRAAAAAFATGTVYPELDYAGCLPLRYDDPECQVPERIILWGEGPLKSNPDGFFGHSVIDLAKRGTRLVSIDPRVNWLSTRADIHLQLRPGTGVAPGMAMMRAIVNEGLVGHELVDSWCYGYDQLAGRLNGPEMGFTPERAAEACGLGAEDIVKAARTYGTAKPAAILWGLAVDQRKNGAQNGQAVLCLSALTGNIDRPGGQLAQSADAQSDDEPNFEVRFDIISMMVVGESRAMLKHHINAFSEVA